MNSNPESQSAKSEPSAKDRFTQQVDEQRSGAHEPDQEQSLWQGGYSPKAMLGTWIGVTVVSIGLIVVAVLYATPPLGIALAIAVGLWVIVAIIYAYRRLGFHYELTSQRFIHQVGVLSRQTDRIEVIDIDDVSFYQGPIQRILGIGRIDITSTDRTHPELKMHGIADVRNVAGMIDDVRRRERKRRSLHIQSI